MTKIKEIPEFSLENIQSIGKAYLKAHPKSNFFHSNQSVAKLLEKYNDKDKSDIEKWFDILNIYGMLKTGGKLHTSLATFIGNAFGMSAELVRLNSIFEAGISSFKIRRIGKNYIALVQARKQSFFDIYYPQERSNNLKLAKLLIDKSDTYEGHKRWILLYVIYCGLDNRKGTLGTDIKKLFEESFGCPFDKICKILELDKENNNQKYLTSTTFRKSIFSLTSKEFLAVTKNKNTLNTEVALAKGKGMVTNTCIYWGELHPALRVSVVGFVIIGGSVTGYILLPVSLPVVLLIGVTAAIPFVYIEAKSRGIVAGNNINEIHKQLNDEYGALNEVHEENNQIYTSLNKANESLVRTNMELTEKNAESAKKLETTSAMMKGMFGTLTNLVDTTKEQQDKFIKAMEDIVAGEKDATKEALVFLSGFKEEIDRLKLTVDELREFAKGFKDYGQYLLAEIKSLVKTNKTATNEQMLLAIYDYIQRAEEQNPIACTTHPRLELACY